MFKFVLIADPIYTVPKTLAILNLEVLLLQRRKVYVSGCRKHLIVEHLGGS
jgi:hypothetical protein